MRRTRSPARAGVRQILNLEWHDIERNPYPNGERATYYNVQFKLTAQGGKQLATWTEWIRVPGGHTHYGAIGAKQITCPAGQNVQDCARQQSGVEYSKPPAVPTS